MIPAALLLRHGAKTFVFAPYKRLILAHHVVTPETTQSAGSRLHLALELIEKAPIRVLGDQRLWARLYQARLQRSPWRHLGSKVPGPLPGQRGSRNLGSDPQPLWSALTGCGKTPERLLLAEFLAADAG